MSVSNKILDAIQILTKSYVRKAGYDKTIQAQIVSCEDATIGKYRCRYQDAIIYAYTDNTDVTYTNGSSVYILVPGSDMTKEKTILGSTEKLGINYISQAEGDQAYNIIGNNCITSNQKLYLDTNNKNYKYTIYSQQSNNNIITIDTDALDRYIKQSSSLIVGATFKTSIPQDRQVRGHYGITYNLKFLDNTSNREVIRSYTVDEDNMINNPYRLLYDTRQYEIFDIDGANFISLESIEIFNKDFPKAESNITEEMLITGDIEISALELCGAVRMTQEEINGVAISFYTPQGTFFIDGSTSTSYKTITAQVRIKGKLASAAQNIPFYWGIENAGISTQSEYYNKYLGRGWKCLNDKNIIEAATEEQEAIIEWVPSTDTYIVKFNQATAKNNKFKVAVVYDENVITKQINIENLTSVLDLTIESSDGTKFYHDIGHPTLTCKVNGEEPANYTYSWAYESNTGLFENLSQTTDLNTEYNAAVAALSELQTAIAAGTKFANAEADNLNAARVAVEQYKFIQRVQGNKIYDVQINHITNFGIFKCSVYNEQGVYCGTCSITLTNSLQSEDLYSLVINNGAVTFQYNENGVAPNNKSLDIQQQIQALSFTVYDNLGNPIDSDIIANDSNCQIRWAIPIKNTMLVDKQDSESSSGTDETETYRYYDNVVNLVYDIAQRYSVSNSRNQIQLTVDYKGMSLTAETDFTFVKQGEPGTNGTEYIVKLVPNTKMSNPPLWPMITTYSTTTMQGPLPVSILNYGLDSTSEQEILSFDQGISYQFFKAQLWYNGELVWQGASTSDKASDGITQPSKIYWEILKNKYNSSSQDSSDFTVNNADTGLFIYNQKSYGYQYDTPYANIIKCSITWQDKTYYGTIPIITAWINNANIRVSLKDYTGWRYAIYTSDGVLPQYDNANPFEFLIKEKINDIWEDVSLVSGQHAVDYEFTSIGNYRNTSTGSTINANLIEILDSPTYTRDCQKNQRRARPVSRYDGVCVNSAIVCTYRRDSTIIGKICVPIHFLLNKYGLAHINEWDGNSIQIDDEGGFILSPQMGAGSKNSNNQFTGVLMGEVRTAGKSSSNIGLFGYDKGDRTFFLNSENGSALFGKQGNGQIIIDPDSDKALLYSNSFWKNYNTTTGLPINYTNSNENGEGLLIDLTTPSIRYGNGNFSVDKDGKLHATEANITGDITATSLTLGQGATIGGLAKVATTGSYNDLSDTPTVPDVTKYIQKDGTIGSTPSLGSTGFVVSSAGLLQASNAIIYGDLYSSRGTIAGWTIGSTEIQKLSVTPTTNNKQYKAAIYAPASPSNSNYAFYTATHTRTGGTDGAPTYDNWVYPFYVRYDGYVKATNAEITGKITATSLTLGDDVNVAAEKISGLSTVATSGSYNDLSNKPTIPSLTGYIKTDGTIGTTPAAGATGFVVSSAGLLQASNAVIYGDLYASAGTVGGFTIASNSIHTTNVAITSNADNSVGLSSSTFTRTINGTSRSNLKFAIGKNFAVDKTGALYAGGATITGKITATSLTLGTASTGGSFRLLSPDGYTDVNLSGDSRGSYLTVTDTTRFVRATLRGFAGGLILSASKDDGETYTEIGSVYVDRGSEARSTACIDDYNLGRYHAASTTDLRNNQAIAWWDYTNNVGSISSNLYYFRRPDGGTKYVLVEWDTSKSSAGTHLRASYATLSQADITTVDATTTNVTTVNATTVNANGSVKIGSSTATGDCLVRVESSAGVISLSSNGGGDGFRGIWIPAHGTGSAKSAISVDTNNNVTFDGGKTPVYTTTDQSITGTKKFNGLGTLNTTSNGSQIAFYFSNSATPASCYGLIWTSYVNTSGRLNFRQYSGSSSAITQYYDQFVLPSTSASKTANNTYDILTTKTSGTVVTATSSLSSIASKTNTNLCSVNLTAGTWIVTGQGLWQGGASFSNKLSLSTSSANPTVTTGGFAQFASTGDTPYVAANVSRIITVTSTTTMYLVAYHTYSSSRSMTGSQNLIQAIRIL